MVTLLDYVMMKERKCKYSYIAAFGKLVDIMGMKYFV